MHLTLIHFNSRSFVSRFTLVFSMILQVGNGNRLALKLIQGRPRPSKNKGKVDNGGRHLIR
jgi:hypothetical protein